MTDEWSWMAGGTPTFWHWNYVKGKAVPLQAWTGPEGSRRLRLPDFKTIGIPCLWSTPPYSLCIGLFFPLITCITLKVSTDLHVFLRLRMLRVLFKLPLHLFLACWWWKGFRIICFFCIPLIFCIRSFLCHEWRWARRTMWRDARPDCSRNIGSISDRGDLRHSPKRPDQLWSPPGYQAHLLGR